MPSLFYHGSYHDGETMKSQAMASESHDPAALNLVSVVSLKYVLRVAVRLLGRAGWNSRLT